MARKKNKSISAFYYCLSGGNEATTQNEHISAMWEALDRLHKSGSAEYEQIENGAGVIHQYTVDEKVDFGTNSQDVFNQISIIVNPNII